MEELPSPIQATDWGATTGSQRKDSSTNRGGVLIVDHDEDFAPVIPRCLLHPRTHPPFHCTQHEPNREYDRLVLADTGSRTASEVVDDSIVPSQSRNLQNADHQPHGS